MKTMQEWVLKGRELEAVEAADRHGREMEREVQKAHLRAEYVNKARAQLVTEFGRAVVDELWDAEASVNFDWNDYPTIVSAKYPAQFRFFEGMVELRIERSLYAKLPLPSDEARARALLRIEEARESRMRKEEEWAAEQAAEAAQQAQEQAEAAARKAKQAEVQGRVWRDFVVWQLSWGVVAEDDGEKMVEVEDSFVLADEPDERGYWPVVKQGEVSLQKFTHVAKVWLFEVRDPQTYPAQQVCANAEIEGMWVRVPPADALGLE